MKLIKITVVFFAALALIQTDAMAQKKAKKSVEPLYWVNPFNFIYSELNEPKHMKMPKPVLADADGDGVTDQFDREPNTPAGAPVDSHGVSRDTDGDAFLILKTSNWLLLLSVSLLMLMVLGNAQSQHAALM